MSRIGATRDTTVVFYGDKNNWWACYAFWVFQLFGHTNAKVMDGGRLKWEKEEPAADPRRPVVSRRRSTRPASATTRAHPRVPRRGAGAHGGAGPAGRRAQPRGVRRHAHAHARLSERRARCAAATSPARRASRGRARSTPTTARSRPPRSCEASTARTSSSRPTTPTIAYCRIGERSSHTWFALKYLLGFANVATTTAAGPSGATWSGCRSRSKTVRQSGIGPQFRFADSGFAVRVGRPECLAVGHSQAASRNCRRSSTCSRCSRSRGSNEHAPQLRGPVQEVPPEIATRPFDKSHQVPQCESDAYVWAQKRRTAR